MCFITPTQLSLCLDLFALVLSLSLSLHFPTFQSDDLRRNTSKMDSQQSKSIVRLLHSATNNTQNFYGNDVRTAAQLLNQVLQYESQQAGFDLTAMKDSEFNEVQKETMILKWLHNILCLV